MTSSENEDKKEKIPYEPPRLFNLLGGGVAYAAKGDNCKVGGSPVGQCKDGSMATSDKCKSGGIAGGKQCSDGGINQAKCKAGGTN